MSRARPREGVPARVAWAVDLLDPQPADRLLEVGGAPGVAAALICERLTTGHLVAVERSATGLRRIGGRNAEHVESGRLVLRGCALADLDEPADSIDVAFAVNVNVFWTSTPERELSVLRHLLVSGGRLAVLYGSDIPNGTDLRARILDPVAQAVSTAGFTVTDVRSEPGGCGVLARA
jgi:SAM-dependent methyltransferase